MVAVGMNRRWSVALPMLVLLCIWVLFWYYGTAEAMVAIWWRSETFNHAFLVPFISLWLIWRQRQSLAEINPQPDLRTLLLVALTGFAWLLGDLAALNVITQFALVTMLVLIVPTLFGWRLTRAMAFPLGFLFFAVPFGEFVMPLMMNLTADFTVLALKATGIPVYREGLHFIIPSGSWSVIEACSGVRYLIASLVVGTLFAYLNYRSLKRRLIFISFSFVVPLVANWLRAYMIVMIGHLSGNRLAVGVDHIIYGWLFFGLVIMIMFMIGMRWAEDTDVRAPQMGIRTTGDEATKPTRILVAMLLFAVITQLPALWGTHINGTPEVAETGVITPVQVTGWQIASGPMTAWKPAFDNPYAESQVEYLRGNQRVGVHLEFYRHQNFDRKLVSSENVLVRSKDPDWIKVAEGSRTVQLDTKALNIPWTELRGTEGHHRLIAWKWYWVFDRLTTSDAEAKVYIALSKLLGRGDDSAAIIVYMPGDQPEAAMKTLQDFIQPGWPAIQGELRSVRVGQ
jgi:exosortase A